MNVKEAIEVIKVFMYAGNPPDEECIEAMQTLISRATQSPEKEKKVREILQKLWIEANRHPIDANGGISFNIKQVDQAASAILALIGEWRL
jgi:hypothetical protein